jgi:hypothetical protein
MFSGKLSRGYGHASLASCVLILLWGISPADEPDSSWKRMGASTLTAHQIGIALSISNEMVGA